MEDAAEILMLISARLDIVISRDDEKALFCVNSTVCADGAKNASGMAEASLGTFVHDIARHEYIGRRRLPNRVFERGQDLWIFNLLPWPSAMPQTPEEKVVAEMQIGKMQYLDIHKISQ